LLIAGLFGPGALRAEDEPPLPALRTLLARGERESSGPAGLEAGVFSLFRAVPQEEGDLPVAAVTRVLDLAVIDKGWWLRADPVHLVPERDRLVLTGADALDITQDEANRLCAELAELYKGDGWMLKAPRPGRWYLKPPRAPKITTTPLPEVAGRDIHPYLPKGRDGKAWHTLLNELQILLHTAKANEERERQGKLPINSLWFWGGGRLPTMETHGIARVWSAEPVSLALARLSQTPSETVPDRYADWQRRAGHGGEHLVVLDRGRALVQYGDAARWSDYAQQLEHDWFAPLFEALRNRTLAGLRLVTDSGASFRLTPRTARRWWRRRRPLASYR
jgi:hypothetical protein